MLFVRVGWKPIEFKKGKAGIVAGTMERLPEVIETPSELMRSGGRINASKSSLRALSARAGTPRRLGWRPIHWRG